MRCIAILSLFITGMQARYSYQAYYEDDFVRFFQLTNGSRSSDFLLHGIFSGHKHMAKYINNEQCIRHIGFYQRSLRNSDFWAIQMWDSNGGFHSGILSGNVINLGDYDECMGVQTPNFKGKFCKIVINFPGSRQQNLFTVPRNAPLTMSVCVPSSCQSTDLKFLLKNTEISYNISLDISCSEITTGFTSTDISAIIFFVTIILMVFTSTVYDAAMKQNYDGRNNLLCSFSVIRNGKTLFTTNPKGSNEHHLDSINGMKTLSQFFVIWFHTFANSMENTSPVVNKFYLNEFLRSWKGASINAFSLSVSNFFIISGLLLSYSYLKKGQEKSFNIVNYILHRYIRLAPVVIIAIIFSTTFSDKMCVGPSCGERVGKLKAICHETWWSTAFFFANFYPGKNKMCIKTLWFLSVDWQFYCIFPILINCFLKWKKNGIIKPISVMVFSILYPFATTYYYKLPVQSLLHGSQNIYDKYHDKYSAVPFGIAGPWLIGIITGIALYRYNSAPFFMNKVTVTVGWISAIVLMAICTQIHIIFYQEGMEYNVLLAALYNSLHRNVWAIAVCWLIFACCTGFGGPVNTFMSWTGFQTLSKLSYSAYVVHWIVLLYQGGMLRSSTYFSIYFQAETLCGVWVLSYVSALLLYLVIEAPFTHIGHFILNPGQLMKQAYMIEEKDK